MLQQIVCFMMLWVICWTFRFPPSSHSFCQNTCFLFHTPISPRPPTHIFPYTLGTVDNSTSKTPTIMPDGYDLSRAHTNDWLIKLYNHTSFTPSATTTSGEAKAIQEFIDSLLGITIYDDSTANRIHPVPNLYPHFLRFFCK